MLARSEDRWGVAVAEVSALVERNRVFVEQFTEGDLPVKPRRWMAVLTCMDARVDPSAYFGLELGECFVLRNAGARVSEAVIEDLAIMSALGAHMPTGAAPPLELAIVRHTNCGMARLAAPPVQQDVAARLDWSDEQTASIAVTDVTAMLRGDVEQLRADARTPEGLTVSAHVYDVETGEVSEVVAPTTL